MYTFAPKDSVTLPVQFADIFNDDKPASFKATFRYSDRDRRKTEMPNLEEIDWEQETRDRLQGWDIKGLEFSPEAVDEVMAHEHIAEALVEACQIAVFGKKKMKRLAALSQALEARQLGN